METGLGKSSTDVCDNCGWIYSSIFSIIHSERKTQTPPKQIPRSSQEDRPNSPAKGTLSASNSLNSSFVKHDQVQSGRRTRLKLHHSQAGGTSASNRLIRVKTVESPENLYHSQLIKPTKTPFAQSYDRMPSIKTAARKQPTHTSDPTFMSDLRLQIGLKMRKRLDAPHIQSIVQSYPQDLDSCSVESEQAGTNHARSIFAIGKMNNLKNTEELDLWDLIIANLKSIVLRPGQRWGTLSKLISKEELDKKTGKGGPAKAMKVYPELEIKQLPSDSHDALQESDLNISSLSSPKKALRSNLQINLNSFLDRAESDASPTKGMKDDIGSLRVTEPRQPQTS